MPSTKLNVGTSMFCLVERVPYVTDRKLCNELFVHLTSGAVLSGWIPVFDTMHGIRGELNVIVKVELFSDFNKYKTSSCGVQFFHCEFQNRTDPSISSRCCRKRRLMDYLRRWATQTLQTPINLWWSWQILPQCFMKRPSFSSGSIKAGKSDEWWVSKKNNTPLNSHIHRHPTLKFPVL